MKMAQYNHTAIEKKWRENWEKNPINVNDGKKEKYLGGENSSDRFDYCINRKLLCISIRKTCDESGI